MGQRLESQYNTLQSEGLLFIAAQVESVAFVVPRH